MNPLEAVMPHKNEYGKWDLRGAARFQRRLAGMVRKSGISGKIRRIAGADVSYNRHDPTLYASVVVLDTDTLETLETASAVARASFPYIPGFLSFREAPAVLQAFSRLTARPDLLMVDGHGLAHPRRCGLACHLGVILDLPAIGVAKSVLVGKSREPGLDRGRHTSLRHEGLEIGRTLRTRKGVAPVYVSIGHRISLETAVKWVLAAGGGYRLPETTRRAHLAVNCLRTERMERKERERCNRPIKRKLVSEPPC